MPYNGLDVIFNTWNAATDIKTDVYALHIDSNTENSKAICMQGSINQETAKEVKRHRVIQCLLLELF